MAAANSASGTMRPVTSSRTMVRGPPSGSYDCRDAAGQRLQNHVAKGVSVRGKYEQVHAGIGLASASPRKHAGELRARQSLAQPSLLRAVADNQEAEVRSAHPLQLFLHLGQQRHVLFDRQPAHKAQNSCRGLRDCACAWPDEIAPHPRRAASGGRAGRWSAPAARTARDWAQTSTRAME